MTRKNAPHKHKIQLQEVQEMETLELEEQEKSELIGNAEQRDSTKSQENRSRRNGNTEQSDSVELPSLKSPSPQKEPQAHDKPNLIKDGLYLFWVALVMGLTVFGGGYAMLPVIERAFAVKRKFVSKEDMLDILALSQSVPGLISINALIMIGYRRAGIFGAIMGVLGLAIPSIVIICLVTIAYTQFITNKYIGFALVGIRAGVIGLLVSAIWSLASKGIVDKVTFAIAVGALTLAIIMEFKILDLHPIIIILSGLVVGFTAKSIDNYVKGKKKKLQSSEITFEPLTATEGTNDAAINTKSPPLTATNTPDSVKPSSSNTSTTDVDNDTKSARSAPVQDNKEGDK